MKRIALFAILLIAVYAMGQSYGSIGMSPIAPTVAGCPLSRANEGTFCMVGASTTGYAVYVSFNAGAYAPLVPAPTASAVTSVNGKTGVVTLSIQ